MHLFLGTKRADILGSDITIDCLWCGKQGTNAHTRKQVEWLTLFHLLPLFPFRTVFVQCDSCKKDLVAKCSLEELLQCNPVSLNYVLVKRVSFVVRVCIVLGVLLCWAPFIGLIPAIIGFFYGRKYGGWMKTMSIWGLVLSILSTLFGLAGLLVSK